MHSVNISLYSGSVSPGPLLCDPHTDGRHNGFAAVDDSFGRGPDAKENDAFDAGSIHLHVSELSCGLGPVLACQQCPVHWPATSHKQVKPLRLGI